MTTVGDLIERNINTGICIYHGLTNPNEVAIDAARKGYIPLLLKIDSNYNLTSETLISCIQHVKGDALQSLTLSLLRKIGGECGKEIPLTNETYELLSLLESIEL